MTVKLFGKNQTNPEQNEEPLKLTIEDVQPEEASYRALDEELDKEPVAVPVEEEGEKTPAEAPQEAKAEAKVETPAAEETKESSAEAPKEAKKEAPAEAQKAAKEAPEPARSVSYESVAEAMKSAQQEPTSRYSGQTVDDESFLAEIYALIGEGAKPKPAEKPSAESINTRPVPIARPAARLTQEALKDVPEEYESVSAEDASGVPGWLKGLFILLISLLLGAMTFYAVASDVLGTI